MGLSLPCLCSAIQCATYPCKLLRVLDKVFLLTTFILWLTFCSVILLFFLSCPRIPPLFHLELTVTVLSPVCSNVQLPLFHLTLTVTVLSPVCSKVRLPLFHLQLTVTGLSPMCSNVQLPVSHLELTITVLSPVCSSVQSPPIPLKTRHPMLLDRADSSLRVMSIQLFLNCIQILPCCFSKLLCRPSFPPPSTRSWVVPYLSRPTSDP